MRPIFLILLLLSVPVLVGSQTTCYIIGDVDGEPVILEIPVSVSALQGVEVTITFIPVQCPDCEEPPTEPVANKDNVKPDGGCNVTWCHDKPDQKFQVSNFDLKSENWPNTYGAPEDKGHKKHLNKGEISCGACHNLI